MLPSSRKSGFTLVELIASATVIMLLMLMLVQMSKSTADTWKRGLSRAEQFRESRRAFEIVTRRLATATLNPYWDYDYAGVTGNNPPKGYIRQSDLRFRVVSMESLARETGYHPTFGVFFQSPGTTLDSEETFWTKAYASKLDRAPVSRLDGLINSWGYFLEVADTSKTMPSFLATGAKARYRSQLLEFREDTVDLSVYKLPIDRPRDDWFMGPITKTPPDRPVHVVAENIIAMVLLPRLSATDENIRKNTASVGPTYQLLSPKFSYDSKKINNYDEGDLPATALPNQINPYNQLPPVVQIAMVALDESSANKLAASSSDARQLDISDLTSGLFQRAEFLESRPSAKGDLATLEDRIIARGLSYRMFVSNVSIRGARWSAAQVSHTTP